MSHIVVYQGADGSAGYEPCDNLDAAIVAAERMRNVDGVDAPRIFRMEEVEFDFRPYYRVELPGASETDSFEPAPAVEESSTLTSSVLTNEISDSWDAPSTDDVADETTEVAEADETVVEEMTEQDEAPAEESVEATPAITFGDESVEPDVDSTPVSDIFDAAPIEADSPPPPSSTESSDEDEDAPSMISVRRGLFGR